MLDKDEKEERQKTNKPLSLLGDHGDCQVGLFPPTKNLPVKRKSKSQWCLPWIQTSISIKSRVKQSGLRHTPLHPRSLLLCLLTLISGAGISLGMCLTCVLGFKQTSQLWKPCLFHSAQPWPPPLDGTRHRICSGALTLTWMPLRDRRQNILCGDIAPCI